MTPKQAFKDHKHAAARRGIAFQFTYDAWVSWWELHLGPDWIKCRGRKLNDFVMARMGDVGPYHPDNVKCITASQNHSERKNRYHKLQPKQAVEIYQMIGTQKSIAEKYGVSERLVRMIKSKQIYKNVL